MTSRRHPHLRSIERLTLGVIDHPQALLGAPISPDYISIMKAPDFGLVRILHGGANRRADSS